MYSSPPCEQPRTYPISMADCDGGGAARASPLRPSATLLPVHAVSSSVLCCGREAEDTFLQFLAIKDKLSFRCVSRSATASVATWTAWTPDLKANARPARFLDRVVCDWRRCFPRAPEVRLHGEGRYLYPEDIVPLKGIRVLHLSEFTIDQGKLPGGLSRLADSLRELHFDDCSFNMPPNFLGWLRKLEKLSIRGCQPFTFVLTGLAECLCDLDAIASPGALKRHSVAALKRLTKLHTDQPGLLFDYGDLSFAANITDLRLELDDDSGSPWQSFRLGQAMPRLQKLDVSMMHSEDWRRHDVPVISPSAFEGLPESCTDVTISGCWKSSLLAGVLRNLPATTRRLTVSYLSQGHVPYIHRLPQLKFLTVEDSNIEDGWLDGLSGLKALVLNDAPRFTGQGLKHTPLLTSLTLKSLPALKEEDIPTMPYLERLEVYDPLVAPSSGPVSGSVLSKCPRLQELRLGAMARLFKPQHYAAAQALAVVSITSPLSMPGSSLPADVEMVTAALAAPRLRELRLKARSDCRALVRKASKTGTEDPWLPRYGQGEAFGSWRGPQIDELQPVDDDDVFGGTVTHLRLRTSA